MADRNGDGDTVDVVAAVFEISSGSVDNLGHWVNDCPVFVGLDALAIDGSRFLYVGESVLFPGMFSELYWHDALSDVGGAVGIDVDRAFNGPTLLQEGRFAAFLAGGVVHLLTFD